MNWNSIKIAGYYGEGTHKYLYSNPPYPNPEAYTYESQMPVANRAIIDVCESWYGFSSAYQPRQTWGQGLLFDAFAPEAFTGVSSSELDNTANFVAGYTYGVVTAQTFIDADPNGGTILQDLINNGILQYVNSTEIGLINPSISRPSEISGTNFDAIWKILQEIPYINSMSGGNGSVTEPFSCGGLPWSNVYYAAYISGRTLAETSLYSGLGLPATLAAGDPIMTLQDADPVPAPKANFYTCNVDSDCKSGYCANEMYGTKVCAQTRNDCVDLTQNNPEIANNTGECTYFGYIKAGGLQPANCVNGNWVYPSCTAGITCQLQNNLASCPIMYGDVLGQNAVTAAGASATLYYAIERTPSAGTNFYSTAANVASDGVTAWDASQIARYAVSHNPSDCPKCMTSTGGN